MLKFRNPQTGEIAEVAESIAYHYRSHGWELVKAAWSVPESFPLPPSDMSELLADLDMDNESDEHNLPAPKGTRKAKNERE
jgi:hypothetical protein